MSTAPPAAGPASSKSVRFQLAVIAAAVSAASTVQPNVSYVRNHSGSLADVGRCGFNAGSCRLTPTLPGPPGDNKEAPSRDSAANNRELSESDQAQD
eukprot:gb/GEZN01016108.1/.p2 GENE.gb/GEZN01016108.1/~~gb/GEZN01016108.1/.p2  ORF type:complete len:104 (+),score=8.78 gb/GEZN01016108.1/:22-312(+)